MTSTTSLVWFFRLFIISISLLTPTASISAERTELSVIIRFTDQVIQPDEKLFVKHLNQSADVLLVYVRVLSARRNTHQYKTEVTLSVFEQEQVIRSLSVRGDIVYAERDLTYKTNNSLERSNDPE